MIFIETPLAGAFVVEVEERRDERGFFARSFCMREFEAHGITMPVVQCNVSVNSRRGTLRGMHFQAAPLSERKLVRCTQGAIHDVIVDLRPDSPTYCRWFGIDLTASNHRTLYVPDGFAHGFQTLADDCEVYYQMSEFFAPEHARGVRWNDPAFRIAWPLAVTAISEKDANYADFSLNGHLGHLVPKLRLGTQASEALLRAASAVPPSDRREAELPDVRSQAELGNESADHGVSL